MSIRNKLLSAIIFCGLIPTAHAQNIGGGINNPGSGSGGSTSLTVNSTPVSGATAGQVLYSDGSLLQAYGITGTAGSVVLSQSPTLSPTANNPGLTISGGSITGSGTTSPGISITGTLNTSGNVDGAAIFANITNTMSGASTKLFDFQIGGASRFSLSSTGSIVTGDGNPTSENASIILNIGKGTSNPFITAYFTAGNVSQFLLEPVGMDAIQSVYESSSGSSVSGVALATAAALGWNPGNFATVNPDTQLSRLGAGNVMLSDSTTATKLSVSQSTDSLTSRTNYGEAFIDTASVANTAVFGTARGGTSTWPGNLEFQVLGVNKLDYGLTNGGTWTANAFFEAASGLNASLISVGSPTGGTETTGTINAAGAYYANGVKGVTCSGALTVISSITITSGIITAATGTGGTCS